MNNIKSSKVIFRKKALKNRAMKLVNIIAIVILLISCSEENLATFSGGNEIYFDKFFMDEVAPGTTQADSTVESFFFYPSGTQEIEASLKICFSGRLLENDISFKLKVDETLTTANHDEYTLDSNYIFHARAMRDGVKEVIDTIRIKLHRSSRLITRDEGVRLVVQLLPNDIISIGQYERTKAIIILTEKQARPTWWDDEVTDNLLGEYSQTKYKLFLDNADTKAELDSDMILNNPDKARLLAMKFKDWLNAQTPLIIDENGEIMVVTI